LDAGVDFAVIFADKCPVKVLLPYYDTLFQNVVDKAFAGKSSTFLKGKALLMKLMEIDEPAACTLFLLSRLQDKKPKIPPTCLELIREGIIAFGAKVFPIKDIITSLTPSFNSSNNQCREQAFLLLVELVRWIGKSPFLSIIDNLRPAQKTEVEKLFSENESSSRPVPTIYLRKLRPAPGAEESSPVAGKSAKAAAAAASDDAIDGRDFLEEIDLTKRLKSTEVFDLMTNEKWSEQLRGLQLLTDILGPTPKLKSSNDSTIGDICAHLKNFLRVGHLQVQVASLKIFALFADGLRENFTNMVKPQIGLILSKAKEKRLISEVLSSMMAITRYCITSIEVLMEDAMDLIRNKKHPVHARTCVMDYLTAVANSNPQGTVLLDFIDYFLASFDKVSACL
jgi:cytoskeleton-associated protein 5